MNSVPKVFVGNVGLLSITLCGDEADKLELPDNSTYSRGCIIVRFDNEGALIGFLQRLIDMSIPFEATYKSNAARQAQKLKEQGRLSGSLVTFDWGLNGAIYSNI